MERSPSSARTCLAWARRERGQKRVPLPPARITERKSTDFGIEHTSYASNYTFAQACFIILRKGRPACAATALEREYFNSRLASLSPHTVFRFANLLQPGQKLAHPPGSLVDI